ncbi:MAG: SufE family protein [Leptolyngbya sp. PLA3]|nr:MAG: SufE family protein [Cyanobacteria bacterium CYA]MCE7968814.1 SufE family protein [Leptolyngbya sp. PL-A3]
MPAHTIPPIEEIVGTFELLGDWEERFSYLLDLGRNLPEFADSERTEARRVHGCQSNVWLDLEVQHGAEPRVRLRAVSDAHIVNGLIAILISAYDGRTPGQVLAFDIKGLLVKIDLESHLSGTRRNGLAAMVERIRAEAAAAQESNAKANPGEGD